MKIRSILRSLVFLSLVLSVETVATAYSAEQMHVLAIGNSFSADAVESHLSSIFRSQGIDLTIGHLSIGGCSLDSHYDNAQNNRAVYGYTKILADGSRTYRKCCTLADGLKDEQWDYISFQQVSHLSGDYATYARLADLLTYVRAIVGTQPLFVWHQTWAYATTSEHDGFSRYGNDQTTMFCAIVDAVASLRNNYPEFRVVIPAGTAIQNARQRITAGNELTSDGYHLEPVTGRYVAALTWFIALTGRMVTAEVYTPKGMDSATKQVAVDAAHQAVMRPDHSTVLVSVL